MARGDLAETLEKLEFGLGRPRLGGIGREGHALLKIGGRGVVIARGKTTLPQREEGLGHLAAALMKGIVEEDLPILPHRALEVTGLLLGLGRAPLLFPRDCVP